LFFVGQISAAPQNRASPPENVTNWAGVTAVPGISKVSYISVRFVFACHKFYASLQNLRAIIEGRRAIDAGGVKNANKIGRVR